MPESLAIVGIELMLAAQAVDLIRDRMEGLALGRGTAELHQAVREHIPVLHEDRCLHEDVETAVELTRGTALREVVRDHSEW